MFVSHDIYNAFDLLWLRCNCTKSKRRTQQSSMDESHDFIIFLGLFLAKA